MGRRTGVSSTIIVGAFAALVAACEPPMPPGLGDRVPNPPLEVVDPADSDWSIGSEIRLSDLAGKPVILDFWASWCAPCRIQHEYVTAIKEQYGDQIVVLGLLTDDSDENGRVWLQREGSSYPTVVDRGRQLADEFWVGGLPRFVLLTPDRRLAWDFMGAPTEINPWSTDSVTANIERLLETQPPEVP